MTLAEGIHSPDSLRRRDVVSGRMMSCRSPTKVIIVQRQRAAIRCDCESLPVVLRANPPTPFGRVFTCLYREGRRGIVREPEGIETPRPGKSSERTWSKCREPDIRNVEAEGSNPFTSTGPKSLVRGGFPTRSATMDL